MKKTLIAMAVLGTVAFGAQAANVTLYGDLNGGFSYKYVKIGDSKTSSFQLADGIVGSNHFGLKGEEQIGDMNVGFTLESAFHFANGQMEEPGRLFNNEARLYVNGAFGEVAAGRFGGLASSSGTYDIFFANADAFDGGVFKNMSVN